MERFESFFEEATVANENVINDYAKWWEDKFMPSMKEKAEKLKYDAEHALSLGEVNELRKEVEDGKKECQDLIKSPATAGNVIRGYIAWWCGNFIINMFTGVGGLIATIIDAATREKNDGPFERIKKSARIGLEILNTVDKILDRKEKEYKDMEKKYKK